MDGDGDAVVGLCSENGRVKRQQGRGKANKRWGVG